MEGAEINALHVQLKVKLTEHRFVLKSFQYSTPEQASGKDLQTALMYLSIAKELGDMLELGTGASGLYDDLRRECYKRLIELERIGYIQLYAQGAQLRLDDRAAELLRAKDGGQPYVDLATGKVTPRGALELTRELKDLVEYMPPEERVRSKIEEMRNAQKASQFAGMEIEARMRAQKHMEEIRKEFSETGNLDTARAVVMISSLRRQLDIQEEARMSKWAVSTDRAISDLEAMKEKVRNDDKISPINQMIEIHRINMMINSKKGQPSNWKEKIFGINRRINEDAGTIGEDNYD